MGQPFRVLCRDCDKRLGAGEEWHQVGPQKFICATCKGREKSDALLLLVQVPAPPTER